MLRNGKEYPSLEDESSEDASSEGLHSLSIGSSSAERCGLTRGRVVAGGSKPMLSGTFPYELSLQKYTQPSDGFSAM